MLNTVVCSWLIYSYMSVLEPLNVWEILQIYANVKSIHGNNYHK